jgi:succinate dehydrogenase/fumarate reductase cytochrome b subunit
MRIAHRLLGLLLGGLVFVVALRVLVPAFAGGEDWANFVASLESRIPVIAVALGIVLGGVVYLLTGLVGTPRPRYLAYETQYGNISISLKALQEYLTHLKAEFPTVLSLVPKVEALDESLLVVLEVRVRAGAPIPEISRLLQERARLLIQEKVGIADIREVEVKIEEIVRDKDTKAQTITPVPPPAGEVP